MTPFGTALVVSLVALVVYSVTLSPSFGFVDKGEMAAVASTLGIAHPTGYPTLMLLGYLFTWILPVRKVVALNIMAALLVAASAGALTLLFHDLSRRARKPERAKGRKSKSKKPNTSADPPTPEPPAGLAGLAALFTALTTTWWSEGNGFEVYSLHALFVPAVILLFLRYMDEQESQGGVRSSKLGLWFTLVLGLSFTNHMTAVLLAPALFLYFFWALGFRLSSFAKLLRLLPGFAIGLLPYVWLPVRASVQPLFNWGDPSTLKRFFDHVTGRQYRVWMFTNPDSFRQQTAFFFGHLPEETAYLGVALAFIGIFELAKRRAGLAIWSLALLTLCIIYLWFLAGAYGIVPLVLIVAAGCGSLIWMARDTDLRGRLTLLPTLLFVTTIVYASGYDIMEIRPYYMTAVVALGMWVVMGLSWLHRTVGRRAALVVALSLVVATGLINSSECNESRNRLVEYMTLDVLENLPERAVIFSAQWDFWVSGGWYMQWVEGVRPDVVVVDPELLRRSWYLDQIGRAYPAIMRKVREEEAAFRSELYKFENGLPYDAATIDAAYIGLVNAMIDVQIKDRPVLVTAEVRPQFGARYLKVPYYLAFRLATDRDYLPQDFPHYRYQPLEGRISIYTAKLAELYARNTYARAVYESEHARSELAERYIQLALSFDPGYRPRDVPVQPLDGEERVDATLQWFEDLRLTVRGRRR